MDWLGGKAGGRLGSRAEVAPKRTACYRSLDIGRSAVAAGVSKTTAWMGTGESWGAVKAERGTSKAASTLVVLRVSGGCNPAAGGARVAAGLSKAEVAREDQGTGEFERPREVQVISGEVG